MEKIIMLDNPLYRNFVSPDFCKQLSDAGFCPPAMFYWKVYHLQTKLVSFVFDPNGYYKEESQLADQLCPPCFLLPAYTFMDIECHLPGYLINSNGANHYEITIDNYYKVESVQANRLPDALAMMWLTGARKRIFSPTIQNYAP